MPSHKTHQLFGIVMAALFLFLLYYFDLSSLTYLDFIVIIPLVFIYSVLPDVDIESSISRQFVTVAALFFIIVFVILGQITAAVAIAVILLLLQFVKHRTFIHTITAGIVFSLPLLLYSYIFAAIAFIAYFSHLVIDNNLKI